MLFSKKCSCNRIKTLRSLKGFKGFSIEGKKMIFSAIDKDKEDMVLNALRSLQPMDFNIGLFGQIGIKYCPWCGKELEDQT